MSAVFAGCFCGIKRDQGDPGRIGPGFFVLGGGYV